MLISFDDFDTGQVIVYIALNYFEAKKKQDNRFLSNYNQTEKLSCA